MVALSQRATAMARPSHESKVSKACGLRFIAVAFEAWFVVKGATVDGGTVYVFWQPAANSAARKAPGIIESAFVIFRWGWRLEQRHAKGECRQTLFWPER